jgi:UDP-glucose 4-epimerase
MRILVTGGAGYIGSVVAEELLLAGHEVVVLDNLSRGHREAVPKNAELVVGDLADRNCLDRLFCSRSDSASSSTSPSTSIPSTSLSSTSIDAVMHFAALIEAGESMKTPETFFRNNTANALTLLEAMLAAGVKRFVFSSTAALFGNPERTPIQEDDPLKPTNTYGESKLLVERMLAWLHQIHGLRYACLRYFNAAGASRPDKGEAHDPETHLIPRILQVALGRADHVQIFGSDYPTPDGTCIRDYIHVSDLAKAHLLALEALGKQQPDSRPLIYNLGNGQGFSVQQVVDVARKITGHPIPVLESPRRAGDPAVLIASSERIQRDLGWKPQFANLESIMESAWRWHRSHPHGYGA